MFKIGCHLSISDGLASAAKTALSLGGNTFQYFTRNPRGSKAKALDLNDIKEFTQICRENGIEYVIAHAPYTMNACSADPGIRKLAAEMMKDDIERLECISGDGAPTVLYNFHPGSHVGQGAEEGIRMITETLNNVLTGNERTVVLLETMAGKGSEVGGKFEELKKIYDGVEHKHVMGVCFDTCHVSDAGYDIVSDLDGVIEEFDKILGKQLIRAVHLNDSMNITGSHKDRHQKIGFGTLGNDVIGKIINHPALRELPFCLETPNENDGYAKEIEFLKELYK